MIQVIKTCSAEKIIMICCNVFWYLLNMEILKNGDNYASDGSWGNNSCIYEAMIYAKEAAVCVLCMQWCLNTVNLWACFYSNNLSHYTYWKLTFSTWNLVSKIPDVKTRHLRISCKYRIICSVMNWMFSAHFLNHEW